MTFLTRFLAIVSLLVLSACGGGGNAGSCPFGDTCSGGNSSLASLDLSVSSTTLSNSGSETVTVTVTALDGNRTALKNVTISVSTSSGVLTMASTTTDTTGTVTGTLSLGGDLSAPRTITLTARSGSISQAGTVSVVPATSGATPAAIEVTTTSTTATTGGDSVTITALVKDASNNALASSPVSFRTDSGVLANATLVTGTNGLATVQLSAGNDKTNRTATVTVQAGTVSNSVSIEFKGTSLAVNGPTSLVLGGADKFAAVLTDGKGNTIDGVTVTATSSLGNTLSAAAKTVSGSVTFNYTAVASGTDTITFTAGTYASRTATVTISGDDFAFISPAASTTVPVNTPQQLQVRLRKNGAAVVGQAINFAATGGTLTVASATTNASGVATTSLTASSAGPVTVQATVAGQATSTTLPLTIVATTPSQLVLQVTPTALPPTPLGSTAPNKAQVVAKIVDAAANPVSGVTVNFKRQADPSGGNLQQASAVTDTSGKATVVYESGPESTASNGVVLYAEVAANSTINGTATLTVNQQSLFIALGTGNTITNVDTQTYKADWTVYVTDANGVPVDGATLTIKAIPNNYLTGRLVWNGKVWTYLSPIYECRNEDANNNGKLDAGEDDNGDGVLWPGNVIAVSPSTVQTVNGRATVSLTYAESYAPWIELRLTASATVAGTESKTDALFIVSGTSEDFSQETKPPAAVISPYGLTPKSGAVCTQLF